MLLKMAVACQNAGADLEPEWQWLDSVIAEIERMRMEREAR